MFDIHKIIPPSHYQHREGFTNEHLIDNLSDEDKLQLADILIDMLLNNGSTEGPDTLITQTLAYLKSEKAVPIMMMAADDSVYEVCRLSIYASIFQITGGEYLVDLAITSFKKIDSESTDDSSYDMIPAFYYLSEFRNSETNRIIEAFINHKEFLVSYNAKRALGMITD